MEIVIAPAVEGDAGELLTVRRAAFLAEGELPNPFRLPPLTETEGLIRLSRQPPRGGHRVSIPFVAPDLFAEGLRQSWMA